MKKIIFIFCVNMILLSSCGLYPNVSIVGDKEAVGAEILIDGQKAGVMEERIFRGSQSTDDMVIERKNSEKKLSDIKPGEIFSVADIYVKQGRHRISIISTDGRRLEKEIIVKSENYVDISFRDMTINWNE